ncbi:Crp/Fnr family transcriptional regulator [Chloroflexota bacterium]
MKQSSQIQILSNTAIFSGLNDDELSELAGITMEHNFMPNEFIFWEGDAPEWLYIISTGQVKVVKHSSQGKEFIISFFGPSEMFGEVAVFENKPYPASAQAVAETETFQIKKGDFQAFLTSHPPVALKIINILAERLRNAQNRLRDFAGERIEQRLSSLLLMLSEKMGTTLHLTRQEIADMAGTTTETTIRFMSSLKERGIIRSARREITILNRRKLRLLSEGLPKV